MRLDLPDLFDPFDSVAFGANQVPEKYSKRIRMTRNYFRFGEVLKKG